MHPTPVVCHRDEFFSLKTVKEIPMSTESKWKSVLHYRLVFAAIMLAVLTCMTAEARVIKANPQNVKSLLPTLKPGDILVLTPGFYSPLSLHLNGTPDKWITVIGAESPEGTGAAVIAGNACCNTVSISNASYLAVVRLRIDSQGLPDVFGISAGGGARSIVHDILIQDN